MKKKLGMVIKIAGILAFAGGLVHLLQPLNVNLLNIAGSWSSWVQFIAGASTLFYVFKKKL